MSKDAMMLLVGVLLVVLTIVELVRTYRTDTTYNVMKRAAPRVPRATDPGLFWFSVVAQAAFFLLGLYVAATTRIASVYFAAFR